MDDQETMWFRIPLADLQAKTSNLQSLYIWRHNMRLSVFLDELKLGGTIKPGDWPSIGWNHPVLVDLPVTGDNHQFVYIRLEGGPGGSVLSPLASGSRPQLQQAYDQRYLLQIQTAIWSFFLCLLLTGLSLWLWSQRQKETLYLSFAAMSLLSALTLTFFFLDTVPYNLHLWLYIQHTSTDWISFFMLAYTAHALNQEWRLIRKVILVACVSITIVYALLPAYHLQPVAYLVHFLLSLVMFGVGYTILHLTLKSPNGTRAWFSLAFVGFLIINLHDLSGAFLSSPDEHILISNWIHLTPPLMAVAFFAHLVHRFVNALEISEQLNRDLEDRVAQSRQALEVSYAENREMELQHSVDAERQKIYRELHDDLGSKLVSIVHSAEGSKQSDLARGALESLRESIYKARHNQQSLTECINTINEEAKLRITGAGIDFRSEISNLPDADISPEIAYNLTRILREGVSNLLQHSDAERSRLRVEFQQPNLIISLIDQGTGRVKDFFASGGLGNIRFRADRIGADVTWVPGEPGCQLVITLNQELVHPTRHGS